MAPMPHFAATLLQAGLVIGAVLVAQAAVVPHLPSHEIPHVLRGRVALSNRLRPWLLAASAAMVSAGLLLALR